MFVLRLVMERWQGATKNEAVVSSPTLDQVEQAVDDLDGRVSTLVSFEADGEAHLVVGGGADGRYVVYATFDNERFHSLLGQNANPKTVFLTVGGQEGDFPGNMIVDRDAALLAAKTFVESGQLDMRLKWEEI